MSEASPPPMASSPETSPQKTDPTLLDNLNTSTINTTSLEQTPPPSSSPPPPPEESPPPSPPLPASPPPEQPPPPNPTPPPPASSPPPNPTPTPTPPTPEASPPPPSTPPPSSTPVLPSQAPPPPPAATTPPPPSTVPASPPPPPVGGSPPGAPVAISPPPPAANNGSQTPAPLPSVHNPRSPSADGSGIQGDLTTTSSSSSSPDTTIQGVMIAGIAVGAVLVIVLSIVIGVLIFLRKRKKPQGPQYHMDGRPPKGGEQYYNDPTQWHSPRPMDQNMQLPPPPGYMGGPWGAPPAGNNSSDMSSGYSGQHPTPMQPPSSSMGGITNFSYDELAAATNGFSQANLLGQGGFGFVHKGVLITSHDRREVAVKSLKSGSGQGEREFQAEVEIISRVHHRHLVSLVGYCIANQQRLLVYEFVPNKTLEFHLHGKGQPVIDWATRLRIAVGSAKGLAYLHEDCMPRIIHRDIKAANILLDNNFEAMVADFGLAKLTSDNFTHVSTRVMGTFGYLAPEYASSGKLTEKSDVFSYGVMLLELITGRRPVDTTNRFMEDSLVDWARPLLTKALEDGNYEQLVDPRLEGNYNPLEMTHMLTCAAASIRHSARRRPKMSQIVRALEGDSSLEDMNEGVKPGQSAIYNPNGGTDIYDTRAYNADMLKFKKMVMSSQDFNSSEYGGTSEFGLNPSASSSSGSLQRDSQEMKP